MNDFPVSRYVEVLQFSLVLNSFTLGILLVAKAFNSGVGSFSSLQLESSNPSSEQPQPE
jgi:hypothetical protein